MFKLFILSIFALALVGEALSCSCIAPQPGQEVCADGVTYGSSCLAFCAGKDVGCEGTCDECHPCLNGTLDLCSCCLGKFDKKLEKRNLGRPYECALIRCGVTKG